MPIYYPPQANGRIAKFSYQMPATADTSNAAQIKATPGGVLGWQGRNASGTEYYFKFYNLDRAPVVGTDIPFATIYLPPQDVFPDIPPLDFSVGISMAITPTGANGDTGGLAIPGDVVGINIFYD